MASKKYTLVLALLGLLQTASFAQTQNDASDAYVFDSSKVSVKNMPQYNEFKNNQYPYPARPKDQWEIGGGIGAAFIVGDAPLFVKGNQSGAHAYLPGFSGNITLRKSISHVFSLRGGYFGSIVSIPHIVTSELNINGTKNWTHQIAMDAIASLNTINHYRGNPKVNVYLLAGLGLNSTKVAHWDRVTGHPNDVDFSYVQGTFFSYGSTPSNPAAGTRHIWIVYPVVSYGGGIAIKLSDKFNLAGEQRFTSALFGNDLMDGNIMGQSKDVMSVSTLRLNMNLGTKSGTRVAPLWWINPNNYVYNELNVQNHQKPKPVILPDADGDGVTDQFDLEPNTPAGAAVDSHGRAKDTDGDGVPDYKDKEILTPQSCFPVNADGVGTCPEPQCCKDNKALIDSLMQYGMHGKCNLASLPSVMFKAGSAKLSKDAISILAGAAQQINANPTCNVKVVGYAADANKRSQQLSYDRVNTVIKYLVEKGGVSEGRIIFSYENQGASNTVDLQPTTETGPNTVPAPFPQYRTTK